MIDFQLSYLMITSLVPRKSDSGYTEMEDLLTDWSSKVTKLDHFEFGIKSWKMGPVWRLLDVWEIQRPSKLG